MMRPLERRIAALEEVTQGAARTLLRSLLEVFDQGNDWYSELAAAASAPRAKLDAGTQWAMAWLEQNGNNYGGRFRRLPSALDRGLAEILFMATGNPDPSIFELERLRGIVPDAILAGVYNCCRNYAYSDPVALKVRQLAGVVNEDGDPLPGYVLLDNGCINDDVPKA